MPPQRPHGEALRSTWQGRSYVKYAAASGPGKARSAVAHREWVEVAAPCLAFLGARMQRARPEWIAIRNQRCMLAFEAEKYVKAV
jgi:hypothetical protein